MHTSTIVFCWSKKPEQRSSEIDLNIPKTNPGKYQSLAGRLKIRVPFWLRSSLPFLLVVSTCSGGAQQSEAESALLSHCAFTHGDLCWTGTPK